jgi:preprotein translocase subunit SecG
MKVLRKISILTAALMLAIFIALPAMAEHKQVGTSVMTTQEKPNTPGTDGPAAPFE